MGCSLKGWPVINGCMKVLTTLALFVFSAALLSAADLPFTAPGMKHDIEFAKTGRVSLTLDAYVPPNATAPTPTCILVHGGGFTKGDKQTFIRPLFEPLVKAGMVWFTINYRLAPDHQWPACAEDVAAAVRWVKTHANEYQVDVSRIALIGESAGGHLVAWEAVAGDEDTRVAAVVPFYAPFDLVTHVQRRKEMRGLGDLMGSKEMSEANFQKLAAMSPLHKVRAGLPPFLLIHGDADTTVAPEQSVIFQARMKEAGNVCDLITVPGGIHGMNGWGKLKSDYAEQMVAWLRKTLK